jgi:flagellar motor switch protein FliM
MNPSLSPHEMDALLNAMKEGQLDRPVAESPPRVVTAYDLTSQDRVIRGQLPTLDSINDQVASQVAVGLSGRLRLPVSVTSQPAQLMKFSDVNALLRAPATFVMVGLSPMQGTGVMLVPEELLRALLAGALGDKNAKVPQTPPETRQDLTTVERSVFARIMTVVFDALARAWTPVLVWRPEPQRVESDPRLAMVAQPGDVAIVSRFAMSLGENNPAATLLLAIPYASVETVKKQLSASPRNNTTNQVQFGHTLRNRLEDIPVECCGVFGHARMTLSEFLALGKGDVVTLDTGESRALPLLVQGVQKVMGKPDVIAGGMALVLEDGPKQRQMGE